LRVDGRSSINFGGISVSAKFLRKHPDAMGRFLKATWRGLRFFKTDWQMKVLEHEVGRADKRLTQKIFDFSVLKSLK